MQMGRTWAASAAQTCGTSRANAPMGHCTGRPALLCPMVLSLLQLQLSAHSTAACLTHRVMLSPTNTSRLPARHCTASAWLKRRSGQPRMES